MLVVRVELTNLATASDPLLAGTQWLTHGTGLECKMHNCKCLANYLSPIVTLPTVSVKEMQHAAPEVQSCLKKEQMNMAN
jgi:hypothetical protein